MICSVSVKLVASTPFFRVRVTLNVPVVSMVVQLYIYGEFDPGSGRTLAACLTHASRTMMGACSRISGERVSNT